MLLVGLITVTNRNGIPISFRVLTAHAKQIQSGTHNSISKVIRVMVAKPEDTVFSEVWDGVERRANTKIREGQSTK